MGGIVGLLVCMYCGSGCRASAVASLFTFHPPSPAFYSVAYNQEKESYDIIFAQDVPSISNIEVKVEKIETKSKSKIVLIAVSHPEAKMTLLYSHGNATDCGAMYILYLMLSIKLKMNVIGYDYTGYGASSEETPTEHQTYYDIESVYDWCVQTKFVKDPKKELILYGQSVGSGPSTYLAVNKQRPCAGLILHSPIMSGLRVITTSRLLACCDIYPNVSRISKVSCPVFIIHGESDDQVTVTHGFQLQQKVPEMYRTEPWWVSNRSHNDIIEGNEDEYFRRLAQFRDIVSSQL